jgi:hypothetical protein
MEPDGEEPKPRLWLAILPALFTLILTGGFVARQFGQMNKVSKVVTSGPRTPASGPIACVETYSVTMHTSEYYVREMSPIAARRAKDAPPELSTVLRGMARSACEKPLKNVRIRIKVRDDDGKRGDSWAEVGNLEPGQSKPFERAWMGRVSTYEIVEIK